LFFGCSRSKYSNIEKNIDFSIEGPIDKNNMYACFNIDTVGLDEAEYYVPILENKLKYDTIFMVCMQFDSLTCHPIAVDYFEDGRESIFSFINYPSDKHLVGVSVCPGQKKYFLSRLLPPPPNVDEVEISFLFFRSSMDKQRFRLTQRFIVLNNSKLKKEREVVISIEN
jgi:hypothetical protein